MVKSLNILILWLASTAVAAPWSQEDAMQGALKIAQGIRVVQPSLSDAQYITYGIAIQRAAKRYGIHPSVLISIAQQESGFRTGLKEGPAGEIGICQVLKHWLKNPKFIREFGYLTIDDLNRPAFSFKAAAWILADLRDSSLSGPLPFWTYYNSREFKNRFKYYLKVSRNVAALRKGAPAVYSDTTLVAASQRPVGPTTIRREVANERKANAVKAAKLLFPKRVSKANAKASSLLFTASLVSTDLE
ncbi:transglycosylase SLT domain-containing protein [bacterium]|nr:transglycosylase SLT domain-containing protein [bacterium]